MAAHFTDASVKFLRGLKRNNDRDWFNARKDVYESELKAPLLAIIEEVNRGLSGFAEDYLHPAPKVAMRIYRDVRFSKDKVPYKTNVAAWWARQGLEKTSGAGFYFHFAPDEILIAAGAYMPERDQVLAIRRHLMEHHGELRRIVAAKRFAEVFRPFDGLCLTRPPKGFPADHPAIDLIMARQWGAVSTLPLEVALSDELVRTIVARFRLALPMVAFLNTPLAVKPARPIA